MRPGVSRHDLHFSLSFPRCVPPPPTSGPHIQSKAPRRHWERDQKQRGQCQAMAKKAPVKEAEDVTATPPPPPPPPQPQKAF